MADTPADSLPSDPAQSGADEQSTADPLQQASACLEGVPEADAVVAGDLAAIGQVQNALAEVAAILAAPLPETAAYLRELDAACDRMLLGECERGEELTALLFRTVAALRGLPGNETPGEAVGPLRTELGELAGSETGAEEARQEEEEKFIPFGTVNIGSPEDRVIFVEFIGESIDHLDSIESRVLELEQDAENADLINEMFRAFHSMKGAAGFLGLTAINRLCHEVETMLDRARKHTLVVDSMVVEVVLGGIDMAKRLLDGLQLRLDRVEGKIPETEPLSEIDIRPVMQAVKMVLEQPTVVAGPGRMPEADRLGGRLVAQGVVTEDQLAEALARQDKPVGQILVEMGAVSRGQIEEVARGAGPAKRKAAAIKVDTERLDALLEMVGELVIAQSQVAQNKTLRQEANLALAKNVDNLSKIVDRMQELTMAMRLMPLRQTFQKMIRLVRDTARKTGKEAQLELSGEETEIDKTVVEEIADPLVHLLRNAVDHGIEKPDEREARGKPREGRIHLAAFHEGGNVVIEIRDDGKGVDRDRVLQKARARGLVEAEKKYTDQEVFAFLFQPGLSTHDKATDISGRGVGMDVVKRNIESAGGRVTIDSAPGEGSVFTIRLPLTMAIVDGMIVEVGSERYVVPTLGIEESVRPARDEVSTVTGRGEVMRMRGELVPLVRMHDLFGITGEHPAPWDALVIVVHDEGRRCGLVVDELLGQQQVVIKSLGTRLQGVPGVSGGCILGDGRVGLILDVPGLIKLAQQG